MSTMNCDPYDSRELYLESIMDLQTELVCRFLPDCTLTYVNDAYSKAFGIPKDQLIGRKFTEFIPESEHEAVLTSIQSLDAQKTKQTYTHKVIIPGEAKAWQQWTDIAILDDQKRVIEIQSTGRNITEQILAEQQRDLQTSLQKLIFSISVTYINIPLDELDKNIGQSLKEIGEFCSADRVYIFEYNFHNNYVSNTNEWCRNGINSQINNLQQVPLDDLGGWISSHSAGNTVQIDDVNELPEASFNRQLLEPQGIKSLLTVPLMDAETCLGFVGLDYVETKRTFGTFEE
ncbi:MAG: PAS domain S-box protein, partial [Balneolales bacterium]|nr:PAS domain S-box protein [Balneolales bacterium]